MRFSSILSAISMLTLVVVLQSAARKIDDRQDVHPLQAGSAFEQTWSRTDQPVANHEVSRTWMWGPAPNTDELTEVYVDAPVGQRRVVYYDKSRMEITDPTADQAGTWYVTNGLLVVEMVSGELQVGDDTFRQFPAAAINVAGDGDDPDGPTYADLAAVLHVEPLAEGAVIVQRLDRSGMVREDQSLAERNVRATYYAPETDHRIAEPFWDYMNSTGTVADGDGYTDARLFTDPFFATGLPITEAYWTTVQVAAEQQDVLFQCFERRCLTYTPSNDPGWQVESGNVGLHYYQWRYEHISFAQPVAYPNALDSLPIAPVTTGDGVGSKLELEVVATDEARQCGLMHRLKMPENQAMLFVFDSPHAGGFWNCNTFVPLTLAWLNAEGRILELTDMAAATPGQPQDPTTSAPAAVYRYVIEANQGWFAQHAIGVGDRVDLSLPLAAGQTSPVHICNQLGFECR